MATGYIASEAAEINSLVSDNITTGSITVSQINATDGDVGGFTITGTKIQSGSTVTGGIEIVSGNSPYIRITSI